MKRRIQSFFFLLLVQTPCWAHSPIKGIDAFYNGLLHPLLVPAQIFLLLLIGFLFGQKVTENIEPLSEDQNSETASELLAPWKHKAIHSFSLALLVGLLLVSYGVLVDVEAIILILAILIGVLVTLQRLWPKELYLAALILAGLLVGLDSQQLINGRINNAALLGSGVAAYLLFLYVFVIMGYLKQQWQKLGIRIISSWLVASSFIVLALAIAQSSPGTS